MSTLLEFVARLQDFVSPDLRKMAGLAESTGRAIEKPHKVQVDTGSATSGLKALGGVAARAFSAFAVFELAKGIVTAGADMEQTRIQFETFTGSAKEGNKAIADLQKFALATPFDDAQVMSAGRQLLAFGENVNTIQPILRKLGNISSATGKDFNELTSLWGKNKLSGIIQGEDLNQLVDAGIPVMDSLARQLGVTTAQVRKMGADGKISFGMLDKAFDELGGAGGKWGNLMEKQSQSVAGRWSSLVGFVQNLGGKLGEALNPFTGAIVDGGNATLTFISQNLEPLKRAFAPLLDALRPAIDGFKEAFGLLNDTSSAGGFLAGMFNRLAVAIRFVAPVIKVAAQFLGDVWVAIAKVVAAIGGFIQRHEWIQKTMTAVWGGAVGLFKGIAEAAARYLGGIGDLISGIFNGDFSQMKRGLGNLLGGLKDATVGAAVGIGKGAAQGWREGFQSTNLFGSGNPSADFIAGGTGAGGGKGKGSEPPVTGTATGSAAGGNKLTSITINVGSVGQGLTLVTQTLDQGVDKIEEALRGALMRVLNDANTLTAQ